MSVKRFDPEDILLSTETVSVPMWSNDTDLLKKENMETSSAQVNFYKDVYYKNNDETTTESPQEKRIQFAMAYGHLYGSGSQAFMTEASSKIYESGSVVASPSSVIYGQYRSLILGDESDSGTGSFHFGYGKHIATSEDCMGGVSEVTPIYDAKSIIAITIDRARYKEKLRPGSLELKVNGSTYIDDSVFAESERYLDCGRVYDIVKSGSESESGIDYGQFGSYGFLLPDIGVILLNGDAFEEELKLDTGSYWYDGPAPEDNVLKFYKKLESIRLQSEETITSNFVFIRARNAEFNYSTNPSNIFSDGELRHSIMINSPQAFITTVGLYNDNNDLLAVAKLSKPLVKDFTKEALIRVKLDY